MIKMHASMTPEGKDEIRTWCWDAVAQKESCLGHWAQQMVVFEPVTVRQGDLLLLEVEVDSRSFQPAYSFSARLRTPTPRHLAAMRERSVSGARQGGLEEEEVMEGGLEAEKSLFSREEERREIRGDGKEDTGVDAKRLEEGEQSQEVGGGSLWEDEEGRKGEEMQEIILGVKVIDSPNFG